MKTTKLPRKLSLQSETLHVLDDGELRDVGGGQEQASGSWIACPSYRGNCPSAMGNCPSVNGRCCPA